MENMRIFKENKDHWFFTISSYLLLFTFALLLPLNARYSDKITILTSLVFVFCFFSLLFYLLLFFLKGTFRIFKTKGYSLDRFLISSLIFVAVYIFFILFPEVITGRFYIFPYVMGSLKNPIFLDNFFSQPRTYVSFIHSILGYRVTLPLLSFFARVCGILTLILFYLILRRFASSLHSFLTSLILLFSYYFVFISVSMETVVFALFFSYLAIYFYILSQDSNNERTKRNYLLISFMSVIVACGFRYELSLMFGIPFLFTLLLTNSSKFLGKYFYLILILLLIFSYLPASVLNPDFDDPIKGNYENIFVGFVMNFYNSIFVEHNLSLSRNFLSLTFHLSFFLTLVYLHIYELLLRSSSVNQNNFSTIVLKNHDKLLVLIIYFLFYSISLPFLHDTGIKCPERYNINFYLSELIILTYVLFVLIRIIFKRRDLSNFLSLVALSIIFLISLSLSPGYYIFTRSIETDFWLDEMRLLENVSVDKSCYVIKHRAIYPAFDFYKGFVEKDVFLGDNQKFYENLNLLLTKQGCYYYYNGFYPPYFYEFDDIYKYNLTKIINFAELNNCTTSTIFRREFSAKGASKNISLLKIVC